MIHYGAVRGFREMELLKNVARCDWGHLREIGYVEALGTSQVVVDFHTMVKGNMTKILERYQHGLSRIMTTLVPPSTAPMYLG